MDRGATSGKRVRERISFDKDSRAVARRARHRAPRVSQFLFALVTLRFTDGIDITLKRIKSDAGEYVNLRWVCVSNSSREISRAPLSRGLSRGTRARNGARHACKRGSLATIFATSEIFDGCELITKKPQPPRPRSVCIPSAILQVAGR